MGYDKVIFTLGRTTGHFATSVLQSRFASSNLDLGYPVERMMHPKYFDEIKDSEVAWNDSRWTLFDNNPLQIYKGSQSILVIPCKSGAACIAQMDNYLKEGIVAIGYGLFGPYRVEPGSVCCPEEIVAMQGLKGPKMEIAASDDVTLRTSESLERDIKAFVRDSAIEPVEGKIATVWFEPGKFNWIDAYRDDPEFAGQEMETAFMLALARERRAKAAASLFISSDIPYSRDPDSTGCAFRKLKVREQDGSLTTETRYAAKQPAIERLEQLSEGLALLLFEA